MTYNTLKLAATLKLATLAGKDRTRVRVAYSLPIIYWPIANMPSRTSTAGKRKPHSSKPAQSNLISFQNSIRTMSPMCFQLLPAVVDTLLFGVLLRPIITMLKLAANLKPHWQGSRSQGSDKSKESNSLTHSQYV